MLASRRIKIESQTCILHPEVVWLSPPANIRSTFPRTGSLRGLGSNRPNTETFLSANVNSPRLVSARCGKKGHQCTATSQNLVFLAEADLPKEQLGQFIRSLRNTLMKVESDSEANGSSGLGKRRFLSSFAND
jgi:hypothetical protein